MENSKRLRSVVQSLAHHSISGLSYIHPHIGRENDNRNISLYLLSGETNPRIETPSKELVLSSQALKEKFIEILNAEKMDVSIVIETELQFEFDSSSYPKSCYARIKTASGKEFEKVVAINGEIGEILRHGS